LVLRRGMEAVDRQPGGVLKTWNRAGSPLGVV